MKARRSRPSTKKLGNSRSDYCRKLRKPRKLLDNLYKQVKSDNNIPLAFAREACFRHLPRLWGILEFPLDRRKIFVINVILLNRINILSNKQLSVWDSLYIKFQPLSQNRHDKSRPIFTKIYIPLNLMDRILYEQAQYDSID